MCDVPSSGHPIKCGPLVPSNVGRSSHQMWAADMISSPVSSVVGRPFEVSMFDVLVQTFFFLRRSSTIYWRRYLVVFLLWACCGPLSLCTCCCAVAHAVSVDGPLAHRRASVPRERVDEVPLLLSVLAALTKD